MLLHEVAACGAHRSDSRGCASQGAVTATDGAARHRQCSRQELACLARDRGAVARRSAPWRKGAGAARWPLSGKARVAAPRARAVARANSGHVDSGPRTCPPRKPGTGAWRSLPAAPR
jgi:hypothetical protein